MLKLNDFDYDLPKELIAQYPAAVRDASRMLVLDRMTGNISHKSFSDFPSYLKKEDALVLNNTKVARARLIGRRAGGGKAEVLLTKRLSANKYEALLKPSARMKEGNEISFSGSGLKARLAAKKAGSNIIELSSPDSVVDEELKKVGLVPLPPYVKRAVEVLDTERYQTVYASETGATAAPTAGLHFTENTLDSLVAKGTRLAYVTLHVSYGTFAPVREDDITKHKMHSEEFMLDENAAEAVNKAKENNGRIVAVGTTSVRVLEVCASRDGGHFIEAKSGRTDLFIYPPYEFKIVDCLLTNFHFPKSTLLMLVSAFAGDALRGRFASADKSAFAGRKLVFKAYKEAIRERYRFFSYGDCMLIT